MAPDTQRAPFPPGSGAELVESCVMNVNDPPPPYPSRERRSRPAGTRSNRRRHAHRIQTVLSQEPTQGSSPSGPYTDDADDTRYDSLPSPGPAPTETTALIPPPSPHLGHGHISTIRRRRWSISHTSVASVAPSLTQTVLSLFQTNDDEDAGEGTALNHNDGRGEVSVEGVQSNENEQRQHPLDTSRDVTRNGHGYEWVMGDGVTPEWGQQQSGRLQKGKFFSLEACRRYFRPLAHAAYYRALFHLLVLNFPYALATWVYLFVFTVAGTTMLMALPLGAVLCFLDVLGARAFARGELALQSRFHSPLAYPPPYPPRPIFTRTRPPTAVELEMGLTAIAETSFYRNTYSMFTDPTSYQALFYFIVIKPSITILLSLFLILFALPAMVLILPAPAMLRAVRRLGAWQANVAIEGLYLAVR
ncbi:hypothetical protein AX15_005777 [Amanita polypyramis BW_CC]|nr:hypothetical protein AX15_005777 [Amanita polypyramis BW_CC]